MKKEIPEELKQEIIRKHNEGLSLRKLVAEINNPLVTLQTVRTVLKNSSTQHTNTTQGINTTQFINTTQHTNTNHQHDLSTQGINTKDQHTNTTQFINTICQHNTAEQTSQQHDIATTDRTTTDDNPSLQALQQIIATKDLSQQQVNELIRHAKNLIALIEESQKIIDVLEPAQSQIDCFNNVDWSPEVEKKRQYYIQIRKEFSDQKQKQETLINTLKQQVSLYETKTVSQDEKEIEVIPEAKQEKQAEENKETVKEEVKAEVTHSTANDEKRNRLIQQLENEIKDIKTEMFNNDIEEQPLSEERMKKLENWSNQGIPPIESERLNYNLQKKRERLEQLKSDKKHKPKYTWADIKNPNLTDEERAKMLNEISSEDEEALFEEWFSESPYGSFTAIGA